MKKTIIKAVMANIKKELKANEISVSSEVLQALSENLNDTTLYDVKIIHDSKAARKSLILINHRTEEFSLSDEGVKEIGQIIYGQVTFGEDTKHICDGKITIDRQTKPRFKRKEPFVIIVKHDEWRDDTILGREFGASGTTIIFYVPKNATA